MDRLLSFLSFVVIDGISYGMVLFLISVGLSVTMGLMRFANLAHGAFAAVGGAVGRGGGGRRAGRIEEGLLFGAFLDFLVEFYSAEDQQGGFEKCQGQPY